MIRRISLITALALLAACGDDDAAAPETPSSPAPTTSASTNATSGAPTTTMVLVSTTVPRPAASAATTAPVPTTSGAGCSESSAFDPDGPLRDQFVDYLVACGFTQSEAACLFDHLDFEDPAVLAGHPGAMAPAFETCQIDVDRMAEIGA